MSLKYKRPVKKHKTFIDLVEEKAHKSHKIEVELIDESIIDSEVETNDLT